MQRFPQARRWSIARLWRVAQPLLFLLVLESHSLLFFGLNLFKHVHGPIHFLVLCIVCHRSERFLTLCLEFGEFHIGLCDLEGLRPGSVHLLVLKMLLLSPRLQIKFTRALDALQFQLEFGRFFGLNTHECHPRIDLVLALFGLDEVVEFNGLFVRFNVL